MANYLFSHFSRPPREGGGERMKCAPLCKSATGCATWVAQSPPPGPGETQHLTNLRIIRAKSNACVFVLQLEMGGNHGLSEAYPAVPRRHEPVRIDSQPLPVKAKTERARDIPIVENPAA